MTYIKSDFGNHCPKCGNWMRKRWYDLSYWGAYRCITPVRGYEEPEELSVPMIIVIFVIGLFTGLILAVLT